MTTADIPVRTMNNLKDKQLTPESFSSSIQSPFIDDDSLDHTNGLQKQTFSVRGKEKPPSPIYRVRAKFHNSADQLNHVTSPRSDDGARHIPIVNDLTGMYNVGHAATVEYGGSNPSLSHSYSSPQIPQLPVVQRKSSGSSPRTLRKLQQLSLSPSRNYLLPNRYTTCDSMSQLSQGSSAEQLDEWSDVISEETLV